MKQTFSFNFNFFIMNSFSISSCDLNSLKTSCNLVNNEKSASLLAKSVTVS